MNAPAPSLPANLSPAARKPALDDIDFFEQDHLYIHRPSGRRLPNVTSIMAASKLGFDPEGIAQVALERASMRGRCLHEATVLVDEDDFDKASIPAKWLGYVESYSGWLYLSGFRATKAEYRMWHPGFWYAGTADRIGFLRGRRIGVEIKTGDATDVEIQAGAYDAAYHFWHGREPLESWLCVKLCADGRPAETWELDVKGGFEAFRAALFLDRYRAGRSR